MPTRDAGTPVTHDATVDAGSPDVEAGDSGPPVSMICGDALRDPSLEECDDGQMSDAFVCTADCRVKDAWLVAEEGAERRFGHSPHVLAGSSQASGAVYVIAGTPPSVWLAPANQHGVPRGAPIEVSQGRSPTPDPNPALAALPDGSLVVGYTDASGISPDIVLRRLAKDLTLSDAQVAHIASGGPQSDVDLLWTGDALVVAYTDTADVSVRRFDTTLSPLAAEELLAATSSLESSVTLTAFAGDYAAAWRAGDAGMETVRARAGDTSWEVSPPFSPAPTGERPALAQIDDERLLLFFIEGGGVPRLRVALLSMLSPGVVTSVPMEIDDPTYASDTALSQQNVRATAAGDSVFVVWEQQGPLDDARGSEVLLQELAWDSQKDGLVILREHSMTVSDGDQRLPALSTLRSDAESLLLGFQQESGLDSRPSVDLRWSLRPMPWVDLP